MKAIFKREIKSYFKSPIGYIFLAAFMFFASLMFVFINLSAQTASMSGFFQNISMIFVFVIPVLTMRTMSEERKSKTDQLLLTAPVKITDIVLGKFFAAASVLLIGFLAILSYIFILKLYGNPAVAEILVGFLGLFLMGLLYVAIGIFMSSITESQVIAAVSTFGVLFFIWFLGLIGLSFSSVLTGALSWLGKALDWILGFISVNQRFYDFTVGTLNFVPVFYFVSLTALFIFLSIQVVEKRRFK